MTIIKDENLDCIYIQRRFIKEFKDGIKALIYQVFYDINWSFNVQGIPDDEPNAVLIDGKVYIKASYNSLEEEFFYISRGKIVSSMRYFVKHKYLLRKQPFKNKGDSSYWYAVNYEEALKSQKVLVFRV